ncbi:MAG: hypothetical protein JRI68_29925, partial [Deltaproteobacteria bacterium]|nr:hypothetical protein [Deltaproteobacteria bacterium]
MTSIPGSVALPRSAWLALLALTAVGCGADETTQSAASSDHHTELSCTATAATEGHPRAYFAPFDPVEFETLCVLDLAEQEVLVAHYNIRRQSYLDKLVELAGRGVDVKVAVDKANAAKDYNLGDDFLEQQGIDIVRVRPAGSRSLMHLKVTVVDGKWAMTGSFNWNGTAALANDENMIVVRDPAVVDHYRRQVLEVRGDEPHVVEGGPMTADMALHFSPEERLDDVLVHHIDQAVSTVDVAMFTFTREPVLNALLAAMNRQVQVRVVMERKQTTITSVDEQLSQAGATVVRGANTIGAYSAMHQKYAILDGSKVITGATNWTTNGTRYSDEDLLIVTVPEVTEAYQRNFADLLWVYGELDDPAVPQPNEAGVLFNAIHGTTEWGDRIVVTGSHPALGSWDPWRGIELDTSTSLFPSWTGRTRLPAGTGLEYKYVTIRPDGHLDWEPGPNRWLQIPENGRAAVISGPLG